MISSGLWASSGHRTGTAPPNAPPGLSSPRPSCPRPWLFDPTSVFTATGAMAIVMGRVTHIFGLPGVIHLCQSLIPGSHKCPLFRTVMGRVTIILGLPYLGRFPPEMPPPWHGDRNTSWPGNQCFHYPTLQNRPAMEHPAAPSENVKDNGCG
jgi:hypothetical protein